MTKLIANKNNSQEPMPLWRKRLRRHVPIVKWLPNYRKSDLVSDLVAGLTLGLTMIPQSIAYASLAGLTAQVCFTQKFRKKIFFSFKNYF